MDNAAETSLERERLEIELQRQNTITKIERLEQLQTEENLETALNQLGSKLGLEPIELTQDSTYSVEELDALSQSLEAIEQRPDLPEELQILLTQTQASIHIALLGEEASTIEAKLDQVANTLIAQLNDYGSALEQLQLERVNDTLLLETAQSNLQTAIQELIDQNERAEELGGSKDQI